MANLVNQSPHRAEQKMPLGKFNLLRTLQKTHLSDVGSSIYCSLSFLQT